MACSHPLHAVKSGVINPQTGKEQLFFVDKLSNYVYSFLDEDRLNIKEKWCAHLYRKNWKEIFQAYERGEKTDPEILEIPCGQCHHCRLKYSSDWAVRCCLEAQKHEFNYFVTLTYDDLHVPRNRPLLVDDETGEVSEGKEALTLLPKDLQRFMKRLRKRFSDCGLQSEGIRFYSVGEYGSLNKRPHYHLILFNCPFPDLKLDKEEKAKSGNVQFTSDLLERAWSDREGRLMGRCRVSYFSYEAAAYVARYMTKKLKGPYAGYYIEKGIEPEFSRMSRMPGIARDYYDQNSGKIYQYDKIIIKKGDGSPLKLKPPKYYDRLFDLENPEEMKKIKETRKIGASVSPNTDKTRSEYLLTCEENLLCKVSSLKREL